MNRRFEKMGITNVKAIVGNPGDPARRCEVELLVDSGATYSLVPAEILESLGIEPHSVRDSSLAMVKSLSEEWAQPCLNIVASVVIRS